jgi:hypothetical protein
VLTSSWPASHVTCNAQAPASHVRNVCVDGSAPAAHVGGGGGGGGGSGLGLSVSSSLGGRGGGDPNQGHQGPLSPSRGPLSPRGYEQPQYGKRMCGDPSGPPEMRQRLQQLQQLQQLQGLQPLQQLPPACLQGQGQGQGHAHSSSSCPASPQSQLHRQQKQAQASQQMAQSQQLQQQQSAQQSALLLQQQQQQLQLSQLHELEGGQGPHGLTAAALLKASREPTPFPPRLGRVGFQSLHSLSAQLGTRTLRLASTGGPGPDGQWAAAAAAAAATSLSLQGSPAGGEGLPGLHRRVPSSPRLSSSPTPLVGADDIIELDDVRLALQPLPQPQPRLHPNPPPQPLHPNPSTPPPPFRPPPPAPRLPPPTRSRSSTCSTTGTTSRGSPSSTSSRPRSPGSWQSEEAAAAPRASTKSSRLPVVQPWATRARISRPPPPPAVRRHSALVRSRASSERWASSSGRTAERRLVGVHRCGSGSNGVCCT